MRNLAKNFISKLIKANSVLLISAKPDPRTREVTVYQKFFIYHLVYSIQGIYSPENGNFSE